MAYLHGSYIHVKRSAAIVLIIGFGIVVFNCINLMLNKPASVTCV